MSVECLITIENYSPATPEPTHDKLSKTTWTQIMMISSSVEQKVTS